ncbi:MAG TPA: homoserine O-acetyltransferase [Thermomicrobiales bacterium]|jgi:homoserine O-acetyltransferase|nr:homoserine O-acetyltransferase [Thermomicrobiales bacterium]
MSVAWTHPQGNTRETAERRPHLELVGRPAPADPLAPQAGDLQTFDSGRFEFELGGSLSAITLAYRTWGTLNAAGDNAVLVLHALTGDTLAAGPGGWWAPLIGPGATIDTDSSFVICINVLGGCSGSTGPASDDPLTRRPYAMRFPLVTIGDIVRAQRRLVEHLGITRLIAIGGSIGGLQALEWATRHADLVERCVCIAASGALAPMGIAVHGELGRRAIMADPDWRGGEYLAEGTFPTQGLATARMAAMTTYHSRESMDQRFGRNLATRPGTYPAFGPTLDIEGYLHHQGDKLVRRFDANSYLYLSRAMDLYDVGRDGGEAYWFRQVQAPVHLVGIRTDWLFPPDEIEALADRMAAEGVDATYEELDSPHGHDAFLKEWGQLNAVLAPAFDAAPVLEDAIFA